MENMEGKLRNFFRVGKILPAVALNMGHVQLWNPGTKPITVYGVYPSIGGTVALYVKKSTAALLTLAADEILCLDSSNVTPPVAQLRTDASLAQQGTGNLALRLIVSAAPLNAIADSPYLLAPNTGLIVTTTTVNVNLYAEFLWRE